MERDGGTTHSDDELWDVCRLASDRCRQPRMLVVRLCLAWLVASYCCHFVAAGGDNPHQHAADAMPNVAAIQFGLDEQMVRTDWRPASHKRVERSK